MVKKTKGRVQKKNLGKASGQEEVLIRGKAKSIRAVDAPETCGDAGHPDHGITGEEGVCSRGENAITQNPQTADAQPDMRGCEDDPNDGIAYEEGGPDAAGKAPETSPKGRETGKNGLPEMEALQQAMLDAEMQESERVAAMNVGGTIQAAVPPTDEESETPVPEQEVALDGEEGSSTTDLPTISAKLPLREQTAQVIAAMASLPVESVVVHAGRLARIRRSRKRGARIEAHTKASLRGVVARCCRIIAVKGDSVHEIIPGDALIEDLMSLPEYPDTLKRLDRVVETPLLLADGRVLTQPGFDADTGIYLWPEPRLQGLVVPEDPGPGDVREALDVLEDIVADMSFVDGASRTNFLAFWITPLLRHLIDGCAPALVIDAPQQGSGKGLLTSIIAITATGREAATQVSHGGDEELHKTLAAFLRRGAASSILVFDNVTHIVNQASLASFTTSPVVQARILGHTRVEEFVNHAVVVLNGNNVRVGGDMSRRVVWSRVDPAMSRPWERTGFLHHPLLPYVKEQRPEIVRAILTIARYGLADGQTDPGVPALGSFEPWCYTLGTILARAGVDGFLANRHAVYESVDEEASEFTGFLRRWLEEFKSEPVAARDVVARLDPDDLPSAVMAGSAGHGSIVKRLAKTLSRFERRRFSQDNIHVVSIIGSGNTKRWRVISDITQ